jgi:eukaryotic-like serine/threonine-protein kinase
MSLNTGDRLLNYEIRSPLGKGGFGMVYLAHDLNLEIDVAVKVMHAELSASESILNRMRIGARASARLRHPNIQLVYYMGRDPVSQVDFVVMEYLPGGSLRQRLASKNMPLAEALPTFTSIASAVEFAHQHGVIHRDLKPDNIMYSGDARLVVTDFDLAHVSGEAGRTQAGQMLGTVAYSSPEQIMGTEITGASDIYSLGVMLFELVTGQHPFVVAQSRRAQRWGDLPADLVTNPQTDLLRAHLTLRPPAPSQVNPDVPKHVDEAVLRALAKVPGERFQSAWEMACAVNQQPCVTPATPPLAAPVEPEVQTPTPDSTIRQSQRATLRIVTGDQTGQVFVVGAGLSLGNNKAKNDIALNDLYASRAHARLDRQGLTYQLMDLGSANGTTVNGRRLAPRTPVVLSPGDKIEIGYTVLLFKAGR